MLTGTSKSTPYILLILLSLIWGTSFILIKQGLKVFAPDEVGALRVSAAALFLSPLAFTRLRGLTSTQYLKLFVSGLMGIFIPAFLFATAQTKMESSVAGIINTLTPLFTLLLGAFLFKQRFGLHVVLGIAIAFGGAILLSLSRAGGSITGFNTYALFIVIACFCYAINVNYIKFKIADVPSLTLTSVSVLLIGPFALVYLLMVTDFTDKLIHHEGAWKAFGFVVLLGCMSTAVATVIFNKLVKLTTPLFTSSVTYVIPVVAVMWGVLDGEVLQSGHYLGMLAIISGVYLTNRKRSYKSIKPAV